MQCFERNVVVIVIVMKGKNWMSCTEFINTLIHMYTACIHHVVECIILSLEI